MLDSSTSTGRIVSFDTSGTLHSSFGLSQPSSFLDFGPMAISSTGQLYSLSTNSGTLGIDAYDIHTGGFLGRASGAGTFSADVDPTLCCRHPSMTVKGNSLYFTTGTGQYVWVFSLPAARCPLGEGFWKNQSSTKWPVSTLTLGSQSYSTKQLMTLLNDAVGGDASVNLAQQLIAADFNVANGSDPGPIASVLKDANTVLSGFTGMLPYNVKPSSKTGQRMINDAKVLLNYNTGALTPVCQP